jgi:RimJ/RimL family protein N-acetyltransferase
MQIDLIYQFPEEFYQNAWCWLNENWAANFDDFSPKNYAEFEAHMRERVSNEEVWCVLADGAPVGIIGYLQLSPVKGLLRGVCFTKWTHGTPVTRQAVAQLLEKKFAEGTTKIGLAYFQKNIRVGRFMQRLGAKVEGLMIADTLQNGQPVNAVIAAFFAQ